MGNRFRSVVHLAMILGLVGILSACQNNPTVIDEVVLNPEISIKQFYSLRNKYLTSSFNSIWKIDSDTFPK
jgi:hypothetical protein